MIIPGIVALWAAVVTSIYLLEYVQYHRKIMIRKPGKAGRQMIGTKDGTNPQYWYPFNRKPFNCEPCLPFWLFAVFLPTAIYQCEAVAILAAACSAGIITEQIIKRYFN